MSHFLAVFAVLKPCFFRVNSEGEITGSHSVGFCHDMEKVIKKGSKMAFPKQTLTKNVFLASVSCFWTTFLGFWKKGFNPCVARRQTGIYVKKGVRNPGRSLFYGFFQNGSDPQHNPLEIFRFLKNRKKRVFWKNPCTPIQGFLPKKTGFFGKNRKFSRGLCQDSISFFSKMSKIAFFS